MKAKIFIIPVVRIGYGFRNIEVSAKSQKEAENKALNEAGDHEYSEKTADYELENGVTPSKVKKIVYLSTGSETTEQLNETGKAPVNRLQKHEFTTNEAMIAFCEGIQLADSLDAFMCILKFEIKNKILFLK